MLLTDWVEREGRGALARLSKATKVTYKTVYRAGKKGLPITVHSVAVKLSEGTGGEVSVDELTDPDSFVKKKRARRAA
jgi:hypothetical protein